MRLTARGAEGAAPVADREGILSLCAWFSEASKETREDGIGLGCERIDCEGPTVLLGQLSGRLPEKEAADWAGSFLCQGAGYVFDALLDQDLARGVDPDSEVEGLAANPAFQPG